MKRVFICSALRGDIKLNIALAERYCHFATGRGISCFAPHVFYTRFLDDTVESERRAGMEAGKAWLPVSDEMWVFVVAGMITPGMQEEIDICLTSGIPIRWFAAAYYDELEITELSHIPTDRLPKNLELLTPQQAAIRASTTFKALEARLKAGDLYEDHLDDLDALLGTELQERDLNIESDWESNRADE